MPRYEVTTVIDAYDTYVVLAPTPEAARRLVLDGKSRAELADAHRWREAGYGDRIDIVDVRET